MKTFQMLSLLVCFSCIFMLVDEIVLAPLLFAEIGTATGLKRSLSCQNKTEITFDARHITRLYVMSQN
ncbi:MAG: hypothetical protein K0R14_2012 [Burkholderiales bacterium]|jgi:hypothetical protein|nr:hypothetical protein [Burkholderiales bacterium]